MREELLGRASRLVPVLKERAARTEQLRQIPAETVKDLIASGLIRIGNPSHYGGHGVDLDVAHAVAWELARGCGSAGWCYSLWTVHNWWLGHFPERAQEDYRRDKGFLSRLCVQAVNRLFEASGAVLESDAIQRFHRDAHGASHHTALVWDAAAENFGRVALGLAPSPSPILPRR